ncbi:MAG: riboflavin biosynthesis protein RibF [Bacteroidia bacterium]
MALLLYDEKSPKETVLVLGTFDGVHRGHQYLIRHAQKIAPAHTPVEILTYEPHPREVLYHQKVPRLTPVEEKLRRLESMGVEHIRIFSFTPQVAQFGASYFVERILIDTCQAKAVVIGADHRFGRGREGNAEMLTSFGLEVHALAPLRQDGEVISSSAIRAALQEGQVEKATKLLGYRYTLEGLVVSGRSEAKTLGFPTANLVLPSGKAVPRAGIYAGRCLAPVEQYAVIYVPPQGNVEVHLLDYEGELYGQWLRVELEKFFRAFFPFSDACAARHQIEKDIEAVRMYYFS